MGGSIYFRGYADCEFYPFAEAGAVDLAVLEGGMGRRHGGAEEAIRISEEV